MSPARLLFTILAALILRDVLAQTWLALCAWSVSRLAARGHFQAAAFWLLLALLAGGLGARL